ASAHHIMNILYGFINAAVVGLLRRRRAKGQRFGVGG
ncbi:hypothetical protein LCGC14_2748300, partial [marine sediment metagenome]